MSHTTKKGEKTKAIFDYCVFMCTFEKLKNPVNLIISEWIRPEDICYYEGICEKTGNNNLSIKLVDRTKNTDFLKKVVKAYMTRSYDGNLLDILNLQSNEQIGHVAKFTIAGRAIMDRYNFKEITNYINFFNLPEITIDNRKPDNFIDKFLGDYPCGSQLCNLGDNTDSRHTCSYCKAYADKAISYSKKEVNEHLDKAKILYEDLYNGNIFN